uniref:ditrans,polycis-polyprenyl diphosphate synthase [(2E,6E)-farnesyldiphosphate specific] n=1 Tax=Kalanchoe fedtschenkoi TaxID=63787 RepID=A0A7N0T246_KALFE
MDPTLQAPEFANVGNLVRRLLWHLVHFVVSLWFTLAGFVQAVESHLISKRLLKSYDKLNIGKVKYLALVMESEDARRTFEVLELLQWLRNLGVKRVCLYDVEGVLKQSKEVITKLLGNASLFGVLFFLNYRLSYKHDVFGTRSVKDSACDEKHMTLEFASISDGKEAVAKAANVLLKKFKSENADGSEAHGYGAPDPDLLLVYGPARCHLGFPAWRLRYTEIVHMSPLNYKKRSALIKAIYKFTIVRQNYGKFSSPASSSFLHIEKDNISSGYLLNLVAGNLDFC